MLNTDLDCRRMCNCSFFLDSLDSEFSSPPPKILQVTSHPEPVSQSMSLQQPPQSQYNMPDRDKQLLFSEFEDLSASFRSLYKSVFEQTFNQQGEIFIHQNDLTVIVVVVLL